MRGVIDPKLYNPKRIKQAAYELSLGHEVYLSDSKTGKVEILNAINRTVDINPGQFALLLTEEKVNIPNDKLGLISIKAGVKLKGLINVSGFHVDPGFNDHLLFSVYNAGPCTIVLEKGKPYFLIWFSNLQTALGPDDVYNGNNGHYNKLDHIPSDIIEDLKRGELASPVAILNKIDQVKSDLQNEIKDSKRDVDKDLKRIEEKKDRNDWLFKIIIGLGIAIGLKLLWDWSQYDKGFQDGLKQKTAKEEVINAANSGYLDGLINAKVDSLFKAQEVEERQDTTKGKTNAKGK